MLLVTASAQLRTVTSALLRRYSSAVTTVAADFNSAIEAAAEARRIGGGGSQFAAAVVDLDLVPATETTDCSYGKDGLIGRLRTALWSEGAVGVVVGIAPAARATTALAQDEKHWMSVPGIDKVLQRWVRGWWSGKRPTEI
jgi:hypothetical protein